MQKVHEILMGKMQKMCNILYKVFTQYYKVLTMNENNLHEI
jgi:hypothetical protein